MTVLNTANALYVGDETVDAVYLGTEKVWPTFTPTLLPGLIIWFDASQLGYNDGAPVSPWPNLGNGSDGGITGTPAPTVRANALNGLPVVRFNINEGRLRMSGYSFDLDYTLVYVGRMWGTGAGGRVVTALYPPSNLLVGYWNFYEDVSYVEGFLVPDARKTMTTNWKLYSLDGGGVSPNYKPRFFSNGVFLSGDHSASGGWKGTFAINGYAPGTIEETCQCEIAEVVFYDRKLSDTDRQAVEGYLRDKWMP